MKKFFFLFIFVGVFLFTPHSYADLSCDTAKFPSYSIEQLKSLESVCESSKKSVLFDVMIQKYRDSGKEVLAKMYEKKKLLVSSSSSNCDALTGKEKLLCKRAQQSKTTAVGIFSCYSGSTFLNGKCVPVSTPPVCSTSLPFAETNAFRDVVLDQKIPLKILSGEILSVSGSVQTTDEYATIALLQNGNLVKSSYAKLNNKRFQLSLDYPVSGNYQLMIIPGLSGKNVVASLEIISQGCVSKNNTETPAPKNLSWKFADDALTFSWDSLANVHKVSLVQNNVLFQKIIVGKNSWTPAFKDLQNFSAGSVYFSVESLSSQGTSLLAQTRWSPVAFTKLSVTDHLYSFVEKTAFLDLLLEKRGKSFYFSATLKQPIKKVAYQALASGEVKEVLLQSTTASLIDARSGEEVFPAGAKVFASFPLASGISIIEINDIEGSAFINIPVYPNNVLPFVPDFRDKEISFSQESSTVLAQKLFQSINTSRVNYKEGKLIWNDALAKLAQSRADDMVKNNYISHYNAQNQSANDLRVGFGIRTSVGENIAQDISVVSAHEGLMRSPAHRKNILDSSWSQVGVGVAKRSDGGIIFVEIFSESEVSELQASQQFSAFIEENNAKRKKKLQQNSNLQSLAQNWAEQMTDQNFLGFKNAKGESVMNAFAAQSTSTVSAFVFSHSSWTSLLELLKQYDAFSDESFSSYGFGVSLGSDGVYKGILVFY